MLIQKTLSFFPYQTIASYFISRLVRENPPLQAVLQPWQKQHSNKTVNTNTSQYVYIHLNIITFSLENRQGPGNIQNKHPHRSSQESNLLDILIMTQSQLGFLMPTTIGLSRAWTNLNGGFIRKLWQWNTYYCENFESLG